MAVIAGLLLVAAIGGLVAVVVRNRAAQRETARVRALFARYVTPAIVDELLQRKDPRLHTGRSVHATILVCRIRNFAGFAEALSAEETLRYLNEFFALAGTSIHKHSGMIESFSSDGIVGMFGVVLDDAAAEEHALCAALDIVRLVDAMDQRWRAQGRRAFHVGIGINSGLAIAGDAGFHDRRIFTVVGPEMLVAARLQELTADLSAAIIATAATCKKVRHLFSVIPISGHPMPGLKRPADLYIVLGRLKESEPLLMPAAHAFKETTIEPTAAPPSARMTPPPPEAASLHPIERADPLAPLAPRRRPIQSAADAAFALPDFQPPPSFDSGDDGPIFPDPPPRRSVYDDGEGPPISLPP